MSIRLRDRVIDTARRKLHLVPRAYLRPRAKRSAAAWFAGLREREQRKIEIEAQKIAEIERRISQQDVNP